MQALQEPSPLSSLRRPGAARSRGGQRMRACRRRRAGPCRRGATRRRRRPVRRPAELHLRTGDRDGVRLGCVVGGVAAGAARTSRPSVCSAGRQRRGRRSLARLSRRTMAATPPITAKGGMSSASKRGCRSHERHHGRAGEDDGQDVGAHATRLAVGSPLGEHLGDLAASPRRRQVEGGGHQVDQGAGRDGAVHPMPNRGAPSPGGRPERRRMRLPPGSEDPARRTANRQQHRTGDVGVDRPVRSGDDRRAELDAAWAPPRRQVSSVRSICSVPVFRVGDAGEPSPVRRRPFAGEGPEQLGQHRFSSSVASADEARRASLVEERARSNWSNEVVVNRRGSSSYRRRRVRRPTRPATPSGRAGFGRSPGSGIHGGVDPDTGTREQSPSRGRGPAPACFLERSLGRLVDPVGDDQDRLVPGRHALPASEPRRGRPLRRPLSSPRWSPGDHPARSRGRPWSCWAARLPPPRRGAAMACSRRLDQERRSTSGPCRGVAGSGIRVYPDTGTRIDQPVREVREGPSCLLAPGVGWHLCNSSP